MKYWKLFKAFAKASFVADLEYRANFVTRIATDIFWYAAQIMTFETLFRHTDKIGGWNIEQTRVFLGVLFVVDGLYMILFHDNLDRMSDRVRKGELDLLLAKPVDSQFMLSLQRISTALIGNLIIGTSWLVYALSHFSEFEAVRLLWLLILVPAGLLCLYSVRFIFCATSLLLTRAENIQYLWFQLYKLGMRPDSIYFPWLRFLILTVLPVGIVASVPATALVGPPQYGLFIWVTVWSLTLLYISHLFWNWCLKHYSSASS
jgi:ABC-2 type transport system permease protein